VGSHRPSDDALIGLNRLATVARLLSGAAHEVNNALQVISGTVEMMESRADVPTSLQGGLARLRSQSSRAAAALAQVLQFARAPRGEGVPVNLREVAEESIALRDFSMRRARLSARVEALAEGPFVVAGNRGDLQQALLNLLINAEQALQQRGGAIVVQLSTEGEHVLLRVIDHGAGIPLESAERAFEPFVTTNDAFESPGLGLWAARVLVERWGGTLTVTSEPAATVFTMRLPARSGSILTGTARAVTTG
jgi:signal transduction histidine kinase